MKKICFIDKKTNKSNIDCQHGQSNSSEFIIKIFNCQKNIQNLYFMLILGSWFVVFLLTL